MSNIRAGRKASIAGIDGRQTSMSTDQVCDIPFVGIRFFNENAVANIISLIQTILLNARLLNYMLVKRLGGSKLLIVRVRMCYTMYMNPVELPSHFVRGHNAVAVSTAAQNMAKYTNWEGQNAVLAKQLNSVWVLCLLKMPIM